MAHRSLQELSGLVITSGPVFVPDEHGLLTRAEELVFNDAPWLGPQQEAARLVHPKISFEVAERVGVASLRRRLLAASSMDLGIASAEAFGQSEALTTRYGCAASPSSCRLQLSTFLITGASSATGRGARLQDVLGTFALPGYPGSCSICVLSSMTSCLQWQLHGTFMTWGLNEGFKIYGFELRLHGCARSRSLT